MMSQPVAAILARGRASGKGNGIISSGCFHCTAGRILQGKMESANPNADGCGQLSFRCSTWQSDRFP